MWFRNLRIFRLPADWSMDATRLNELLAAHPLKRCGGFDMISRGWVYPRVDEEFVHAVNRQWLLALGVEQKLLPTTVVRQVALERAAQIEAEQNRKVGRKELRDLRDQVTDELLPKAFTRRRTTWGWIDPVNGWLVIDAGSDARADEFMESLSPLVEAEVLRLLQTQVSPGSAMTEWLTAGDAPAGFTIDRDLELKSSSGGDAAIRYVRHDLEGKEIQTYIGAGKIVTRLGMTWNDKVSFVLNDKLQIKRLAFLDILKEEAGQEAQDADEQFDVDFTLMAGELAQMFGDLVTALGGELRPV
jgi:recombination associated protein RdgC